MKIQYFCKDMLVGVWGVVRKFGRIVEEREGFIKNLISGFKILLIRGKNG